MKLSEKISKLNQLGIKNLVEQGVTLSSDAKTLNIIEAILEIVANGIEYSSIDLTNDKAVSMVDSEGISHTLKLSYDGSKILEALYDTEEPIKIYYGDSDNPDKLTGIGDTSINLNSFDFNSNLKIATTTVINKPLYLTIPIKPVVETIITKEII
jgi:hypothetical protein